MVGVLFDNVKIFTHLELFDSSKITELTVLDSNEYDYLIHYAVSNGNVIMNSILTQQLIEEDCSLIISISEFNGIPEVINIVNVLDTELPFEPNLVSFNKDLVQVQFQVDLKNSFYGVLYTATALDVHLLALGIAKDSYLGYQKLNKTLRDNLNAILKSEMAVENDEAFQLGYELLNTFKKVNSQLISYTNLLATNKEGL